jgi:hypothetical protein
MRTMNELKEKAINIAYHMVIDVDIDANDVQLSVVFYNTSEDEIREFIDKLNDGSLEVERDGMEAFFYYDGDEDCESFFEDYFHEMAYGRD